MLQFLKLVRFLLGDNGSPSVCFYENECCLALNDALSMCVVGEPLNSEAWQWYHTVAGKEKCTVVDTWFQTGKVQKLVII